MKSIFISTSQLGKGLLSLAFLLVGLALHAQVTTSTIAGFVTDASGEGLPGATVVATHVPSGSKYGTVTNAVGRYTLPAVRVGGPFTVTVTYTGFETQNRENIWTSLGTAANVNFDMVEMGKAIGEVTVTALKNDIFSDERTGAATTFDRRTVNAVPIIGSRSINDITKYNPNGNGRSFGAQDSRLNNFTIDGSVFNNGFGLGSEAQAGGRTGSTAISLDAIEEVQVNVAPYDVRQSGFVGSGINAVTRSGTNDYSGSVYYNFRNDNLYGSKAGDKTATIGDFDEKVIGARVGGPIIKDKLFFFVNGEMIQKSELANSFVAVGSSLTGNPTRVQKADLDQVRDLLKTRFNYETGPYEGYNNETESMKFIARFDYNINTKNKLTLRYTHHDSQADQPISNSTSLGAGNRTNQFESISFQNSGYIIEDNTRSVVAELNSTLNDKIHNNFLVGYDKQLEDRQYKGEIFPTVDILNSNRTYIAAGFDPFTPSNQLDYGTFHITDNVNLYLNKHTVTVGANYEYYKSNNTFFPGANGVYIFNSLADFIASASSDADTSPVKINRFQYRYSALPGEAEPLQVLKANKFDIYGQDAFDVTNRFKLTLGLRASVISFGKTALANPAVDTLSFIGEDNNPGSKISTGNLPETKILWEPRLGFNYALDAKRKTQIRGGTGVFTGRPPYVWVSNQIGNNGILTGFETGSNTTKYKFTDDVHRFKPNSPKFQAYDLALTDADYRFPQVWKSNLAVDQKLPFGLVGTVEFLFNKNINAIKYFNANLAPTDTTFKGVDTRPRFLDATLHNSVFNAIVMTNTNEGYYFGSTLKLEYPFQNGFYGMFAYTYSQAKDLMSAGSIAAGSWTGVRSLNGNNNLELAISDNDIPHRFVGLASYEFDYGNDFFGSTQFSLGYIGSVSNRFSFSIGGDMNGDGARDNDLLFIPNKASDLKFSELKLDYFDENGAKQTVIYSPDEQAAAFEAYIAQDDYLSANRGKYAERNALLFPWLHRFDLGIVQNLGMKIGGKKNAIQLRADILNVGNLVSKNWGVGNVLYTNRPINSAGVGSSDGVPVYRMSTITEGRKPVLLKETFTKSASALDVWSVQLGIRYTFN